MTTVYYRKRRRKDGTVTYSLIVKRQVRAPDGSVTWKPHTVASGIPTEREAKRLRKERRALERAAGAGVLEMTPTAGAAIDAYLEDLAARVERGDAAAASYRGFECKARLHVKPALGHIELGKLDVPDVQQMVNDLQAHKRLGPETIGHCVAVLKAAINFAKGKRSFRGENVAESRELSLPRKKKKTQQILSPDEMRPVLAEVPATLRPFMAFCLLTGVRPIEALRLTPALVDLRAGVVYLQKTKTGHQRVVPISDDLRPYLDEVLEHATPEELFPGARGTNQHRNTSTSRTLRAAMVRAAAKGHESLVTGWTLKCRRRGCGYSREQRLHDAEAKCPKCNFTLWPVGHARDVKFYGLRHTMATKMVADGVPLGLISEITGHSVKVLQTTYTHLQPEQVRRAAEAMNLPAEEAPKVLPAKKRKRKKGKSRG